MSEPVSNKTKLAPAAQPAPIAAIPAAVPSTTFTKQPEIEAHAPKFAPVKHPLRLAIHGRKHLVQPLKDMIAADTNIPAHYRDMLHAEIGNLTSNAAQVDLHIVDHADGSVSIQAHIKPVLLG